MHRMSVSFSEPQSEWLEAEAARLGISVGELLRRFVDQVRPAETPHRDEIAPSNFPPGTFR
jgi:hypothetical protein